MSFTSDLRGLTIIDDSNAAKYAAQAGGVSGSGSFSGGYTPRPYEKHPFASYARGFSGKTIPRNEWADRIKERQERKATLRGLHKQLKIPVLNQNGLPYCWFYGLTAGMMLGYGRAGFKVPHLSATSCAAKIKGYRKEGGWAGEGIEGLKKYGVSTVQFWPEHQLDRKYDTPEQRANAKLHDVVEFEELRSNSFDELMTLLLLGFPVTMGLMWWGHLVCGVDPVVIERGRFGILIVNSWDYSWEDGGFAVLDESKSIAHEQIAIRTVQLATAA